jgi:hypothetical protein
VTRHEQHHTGNLLMINFLAQREELSKWHDGFHVVRRNKDLPANRITFLCAIFVSVECVWDELFTFDDDDDGLWQWQW